MQSSFSAAIADRPLQPFQWLVMAAALVVLVIEGIDLQSLPIVTPLILEEWRIDRALFGPALAAALFGMAFGSSLGGWLGDRWGRLKALYLASLIFGASTIAAAYTDDVWLISAVRAVGGLGFGAGYPNALALVNDWVPARVRTYVIATLSIGIPLGTALAAAVVPPLLGVTDWRGIFRLFGIGSLVIGTALFLVLRESPPYLLARGRTSEAQRNAARVIDPAIELVPEPVSAIEQAAGTRAIGVLHPSNARLNLGIGLSFAACTTLIYGLSSWASVFLTASGFTTEQAAGAIFWFGILSMLGAIAAGWLVRRFGSRVLIVGCATLTLVSIVALGVLIDRIAPAPSWGERQSAALLVGVIGGLVSMNIAGFYAVMAVGYPQSCRAAAIGFHLTVARVGVITMVFAGGWLMNLGQGSFVYYFGAMGAISLLMYAAALIVDRHIVPLARTVPAPGT
ncbi:MAG TPA: MFS transporter [Croceibacterium sp.]|nr:MFS transporter [Croceibacterium sp.]